MTVGELDERMSYPEWLHWVALAKIGKDAADNQGHKNEAKEMADKAIAAQKGR